MWGKAEGLEEPYPLLWHMLDAAAAAEALWDVYLSAGQREAIRRGLGLGQDEEQAPRIVVLWAALHDIGKLSVPFQAVDERDWGRLRRCCGRNLGCTSGGKDLSRAGRDGGGTRSAGGAGVCQRRAGQRAARSWR